MLDILESAFYGFSTFIGRTKGIALKLFFYGFMFLAVIGIIIQSELTQLYGKYISFMTNGFIVLFFTIMVLQMLETFFKAMQCLIHTRDKNTVAKISMDQQNHFDDSFL